MKNDSFYDTDNYKKKRQTSNKSSVSYRTSKTRNASYKPVSAASSGKKTKRMNEHEPNHPPKKVSKKAIIPINTIKRSRGSRQPCFFFDTFFAFRFSVKGAFSKIKKYPLDKSNVTVNDTDANIKDYQNIALFGVDSQDNKITDTGSRTDCIIIASIHKSNHKVKLMSIYRDTYVSIDGEYDKINAAYSYGGPELALRTINRNLDLNITDFATVNLQKN